MRTIYLYIVTIIVLAILSVLTLGIYAGMFKRLPTGFNRTVQPNFIIKQRGRMVSPSLLSVAGLSNGHLYFRTKQNDSLYFTEPSLQNGQFTSVKLTSKQLLSRNVKHQAQTGVLVTYLGDDKKIVQRTITDSIPVEVNVSFAFTRGINLPGSSSYILRTFNPAQNLRDQHFIKINGNGEILHTVDATPVFNDGGIATDGLLAYDSTSNLITYTFFYSNKVLCLDTNLNLVGTLSTVDTFSSFYSQGNKPDHPTFTGSVTNDRPAMIINYNQAISHGRLYNISMIKADNESNDDFKHNTVIDVYDLKTKTYLYSFYLPNVNGNKVRSIYVYNNTLVALYKGDLLTYGLRQF